MKEYTDIISKIKIVIKYNFIFIEIKHAHWMKIEKIHKRIKNKIFNDREKLHIS